MSQENNFFKKSASYKALNVVLNNLQLKAQECKKQNFAKVEININKGSISISLDGGNPDKDDDEQINTLIRILDGFVELLKLDPVDQETYSKNYQTHSGTVLSVTVPLGSIGPVKNAIDEDKDEKVKKILNSYDLSF